MTNRPIFDPISGLRIRYADSLNTDANGGHIAYGPDRSNPAQFDQQTGLMNTMTVAVNLQGGGSAAPAAGPGTATVTRSSTTAIGAQPEILDVEAGTTVGAARRMYSQSYGMEGGLLANVNQREVNDSHTLRAGDRLVFRLAMKARG
jgi:molybdopterin converting factor small subunit